MKHIFPDTCRLEKWHFFIIITHYYDKYCNKYYHVSRKKRHFFLYLCYKDNVI